MTDDEFMNLLEWEMNKLKLKKLSHEEIKMLIPWEEVDDIN